MGIGLTCMQIIQEVHGPDFNCNCASRTLPVYLPGGWAVPLLIWVVPLLIWWVGGRHSDNRASLSSSETVLELPTGTELGNN